ATSIADGIFMNLASVRFNDSNDDRIPASRRSEYQHVLRQAIEACRPPGEAWSGHSRGTERDDANVRLLSGNRCTRFFTYLPEDDDAQHSGLFKTACWFLRVYWRARRVRSIESAVDLR